jgi:hypothetical protein
VKTFFFGSLLLAGVGCMQFQPIGPLAGMMKPKESALPATKKDATPAEPVTVAAERPIPPAMLIQPGDVNQDDPRSAAQKLMSEYEYDRNTTPAPPTTAEISVIPGRSP